ncbi:hypothetical protein CYY_010391 [Polysphondylium violaceum]|uniref:Large ribosomal subunit protein bL25 L25 domain-containing protein n=1 Tax=Polysphondylium violaceum TaxID=133409 RepID=A0A8J4UNR0_9MYCE|nr:hypothetical protein CYY_010391 [Polysphondylium violaceum]
MNLLKSISFGCGKTITSPLFSTESITQSVLKRSFFVRGKKLEFEEDPNAAKSYQAKHIFCVPRKPVGKAGVKRVRDNGFIPAIITGGGLPLQNISIELGRIEGLLLTNKFYKSRKYILNIDDKQKIVGKLSFAQMHPVNEKPIYLKFSRCEEDPTTFTEERLPHLVLEDNRLKKLEQEREIRKEEADLQNIDLSFKPVIKKSN